MSQKTKKLLARFASMTGRNYDALKRWFDDLSAPQRDEAVQHMKETLDRAPATSAAQVDEKDLPDEEDVGL